jgi:hypothetical protein
VVLRTVHSEATSQSRRGWQWYFAQCTAEHLHRAGDAGSGASHSPQQIDGEHTPMSQHTFVNELMSGTVGGVAGILVVSLCHSVHACQAASQHLGGELVTQSACDHTKTLPVVRHVVVCHMQVFPLDTIK